MKKSTTTKINILFPYMGNSIGGSHISSLILVKNLPQPYHPIVLLHKRGPLANYLEENNIPYVIEEKLFTDSNGKWQYMFAFNQFTNLLKRLNIDIVHTNEINMHTTWLLPAFFSRVKHLWHQRTPGPNKSIYLSFLSAKTITISDYTKRSLPFFLRNKIEVVFNPFIFLKNDKQLSSAKKYTKLNLAWIGNFHRRKRLDVFINVIGELEKIHNIPPINAHVYGSPLEPISGEIEELIAKKKLKSKILFHGFVSDITSEINKIDFLIATAEKEAFGRTIVEAASMGVPTIANKEGGHKEIIIDKESGVLIQHNDIDNYVTSIVSLIENSKFRNELIKKAYDFCAQKFSINAHILHITKIYKSLIN